MKKRLRILLFVGLLVSSFSSIKAQVKIGVNGLQPNNLTDVNPTYSPQYGKASWYSVVDIAARNAITSQRRDTGMIVHVRSVDSLYQLKGGILNSNWTTNITLPVTAASITIGAINGQPKVANGATVLAGVFYNQTSDFTNPGLLTSADYTDFKSRNKGIQFKNQGANIGTQGAIDSINFAGAGVTAAASGSKVTVTISGIGAPGTGLATLNGDTSNSQSLSLDTLGTKPYISDVIGNHTIHVPLAGLVDTGVVKPAQYISWSAKIGPSDTSSMLSVYLRKFDTTLMLNPYARGVNGVATRVAYFNDARTITGSPDYVYDSTNKRLTVNAELDVTGTFASGADLTLAGTGTRMFFYPKKAAFRAGNVSSTQWNKDSVGNYTGAFGVDTKVVGNYSFSAGNQNTIYGLASVVFGSSNTNSGNNSSITGSSNNISADNSIAGGANNIISSTGVAFGLGLKINQLNKTALGKWNDSTTSIKKSLAIGWGTADNARTDVFYIDTLGTIFLKPGNTAARPSVAVAGMIRYNTDSVGVEFYTGTVWVKFGSSASSSSKLNIVKVGTPGIQLGYVNATKDTLSLKYASGLSPILVSTLNDSTLRVALDSTIVHTFNYNEARYLKTIDTTNIPSFAPKVRSEFSIAPTTPIAYNSATGVFSLNTVTGPFGGTGQISYNKGDLLVGVNSTTLTKLGAGPDNYVLISDATQASGLRWGPITSTSFHTVNVGPAGTTLAGYVSAGMDSLYLENIKASAEISPIKNSDSTVSYVLNATGVAGSSCIGCNIAYDSKGRILTAASGITGVNGNLAYKTPNGEFTAPIKNDSANGRIEFDKQIFFPAFATTGSLYDFQITATGKNGIALASGTASGAYVPLNINVNAQNGVYNILANLVNTGTDVLHLNGMAGNLIEVNQDSADAFTSFFNTAIALNTKGFAVGYTKHFGKDAEFSIAYTNTLTTPNFYFSKQLFGIDSVGQLRLPRIAMRPTIDTTTFKVLVADAGGNLFKMNWPATGGAGGGTCSGCIPYVDTTFTIATQQWVRNHTNGTIWNLDYIIGDGQPNTPSAGTNVYVNAALVKKYIISMSQEGIEMPLTPRAGSVYGTYNAAAGTITLSNGSFETNTYYKIIYKDTSNADTSAGGFLNGFMAARDTVHQVTHGFTVGKVVYFTGSTWSLADTIVANTFPISGIVSKVVNADYFEVTHAGKVTWTGHGLTLGVPYYLTVNGNVTSTAPNVTLPVLYAIDANTVQVQILRGSNGLASGGSGGGSGGVYVADETTLHLAASPNTFSIKTTYPGQTSITTLGTINQGVWQGTAIGSAYGGVPAGGTAAQVLTKVNGSDYNVQWTTVAGVSTPTLQQVVTAGSTLSGNNLITLGGGTNSLIFGATSDNPVTFQSGLIAQGLEVSSTTQSSNYTVTKYDVIVTVDASAGAKTITLPNLGGGQLFVIKKIDNSTNPVTLVATGGGQIDGKSTYSLLSQNESITVSATGAFNYNIVGFAGSSGSYTPSFTNTTNITTSTLDHAVYTRMGNVVTVTISGVMTPTATTGVLLTFTLPIATSNGTQNYVGTGVQNMTASWLPGMVNINSTTTGTFQCIPTSSGFSQAFSCTFSYKL